MADADRSARLGGMALANGLLVHGPRHWAAAVRTDDGRVVVGSGSKPRLVRGAVAKVPLVRGVLRLGEAMAVVPLARRGLPEARLAMEDAPVGVAMIASTAIAALARKRLRSVLLQETIGALAGVVPALVTLRTSETAVWHGVEHKSIAAYEVGGAAGVAHASEQAKEHERCGSNLVAPLIVTTVAANTAVRKLLGRPGVAVRVGVAAASIGVAVEVFAFAARKPDHPLARAVHGLGHALQAGFATREPAPADLAVGRAAMEELLRIEGVPAAG